MHRKIKILSIIFILVINFYSINIYALDWPTGNQNLLNTFGEWQDASPFMGGMRMVPGCQFRHFG